MMLGFLCLAILSAKSQGFRTEFGKNRVQTKEYEWRLFKNDKFDVYYYEGGRDLAAFVNENAEEHINKIEAFFDFRLEDKIIFVLYNSKSDLNQSNMFLERDAYNLGGTTRIIDNTTFINFNGSHKDFVGNMREGIGRVVVNEMLYGGSIQERLQNSTLLHLPEWYTEGLIKYLANGWGPLVDAKLRNGILYDNYKRMASLEKSEKLLVSQGLWMYIEKRYGKEAVSNILYVSRVNKSMESGYMYVLGKSLAELYDEWYEFTYYRYLDQQAGFGSFPKQVKLPKRVYKKRVMSAFAMNPQQSRVAMALNKQGKTELCLYSFESEKLHRVLKMGYISPDKEIDLSYPVMSWDEAGEKLYYIIEKDGFPHFITYHAGTKTELGDIELTQLDKVYSMSLSPRGRSVVFSGLKNGRTDILVLDIPTGFVRPVTSDDYDDLHPIFVNDGKGIVFSSNRPNEEFKSLKKFKNYFQFQNHFDLFYYDYAGRANKFTRLTFSGNYDEYEPALFQDSLIMFRHNALGNFNVGFLQKDKLFKGVRVIVQKKNSLIESDDTLFFDTKSEFFSYKNSLQDSQLVNVSSFDTMSIFQDTSYSYNLSSLNENVLGYQLFENDDSLYFRSIKRNNYGLFRMAVSKNIFQDQLSPGQDFEFLSNIKKRREDDGYENDPKEQEEEPDSFRYTFQTGFEDLEYQKNKAGDDVDFAEIGGQSMDVGSPQKDKKRDLSAFYYLAFSPDEIITQFDVGNFNTPYLPYRQGENFVRRPGLRGLSRIAISDMFKDYRLEAGARPTINLNGFDYFARYQNFKKRIDKEIFFFRTENQQVNSEFNYAEKEVSQEIRTTLRYPFSEVASLRLQAYVRQDILAPLSTSRDFLELEPQNIYWGGGKLSYVFDNSRPDGVNIWYGTKYKLYYEHFSQINGDKSLNIIGGDFRNSLKIYRALIWANRFAFASSLGSSKVVYFLGGTENWLAPRFHDEISVDEEIDYVYKANAVNLRGFRQNIRNGASYALINSEVRMPIFRLLSRQPLKSSFLENFQIIGFSDVGVAFNGYSPFSEENVFNKRIFEEDPLRIERWSLRRPVVGGYGFGVRTNLLGYFVRLDWAWGVESGIDPDRMFYLSLGTDF